MMKGHFEFSSVLFPKPASTAASGLVPVPSMFHRASMAEGPTRYSLRKRGISASDGLKPCEDREFEKLLKEHEASGEREREERRLKRRRRDVSGRRSEIPLSAIHLDALPSLCIQNILGMLSSSQDVYNLAFTSKYILSLVNAEIVIRSAVFQDIGKRDALPRKVLKHFFTYLLDRSIKIPSALRLLRLANARVCERWESCYGFDLANGKPCSLYRNQYRPFGLALCGRCIKGGTYIYRMWNGIAREKNVATYDWNRLLQGDAGCSRSACGPLIVAKQVLQIENSYPFDRKAQKEALQKIIDDSIGEDGCDERKEYESRAVGLVDIWEKAEADATAYLEARDKAERDLRESKEKERNSRRLSRIRPIHKKLQELLEGAPLADMALNCDWCEHHYYCLRFSCPFVLQVTNRMVVEAPASVKQSDIVAAANTIRANFAALSSSRLLERGFVAGSRDLLKRAMQRYIDENLTPPLKLLFVAGKDSPCMRLSIYDFSRR